MRRSLLFFFAAAAGAGICHGLAGTDESIHQAAAFYHQERFDSALARLDAMKTVGPWKRRDSISYHQYSGMAASKLGRSHEAAAHFSELLALDTLFQFPRNEDPQVLENFARARTAFRPPAADPAEIRSGSPQAATAVTLMEPAGGKREGGFSFIDSVASARTSPSAPTEGTRTRNIGLAHGAWPAGAGWLAKGRRSPGLALGLLQAGGLGLSLYASHRVSREEGDLFAIRDGRELESVKRWQLTQRLSLSTALGAYLFSLIASAGD